MYLKSFEPRIISVLTKVNSLNKYFRHARVNFLVPGRFKIANKKYLFNETVEFCVAFFKHVELVTKAHKFGVAASCSFTKCL